MGESARVSAVVLAYGTQPLLEAAVGGILDSAGARLHEGSALSRPFNRIFINQSIYSGVVPQIQILLGLK